MTLASTPSSRLWGSLDTVVHQTARSRIDPVGLDREACRLVLALDEEIASGNRVAPRTASDAAKQIVGCFRARDFVDVETYVVALAATLAQQSEIVVRMAACPVHGIPRRYKFIPSIAEVADDLERTRERITRAAGGAARGLALPTPSGPRLVKGGPS